MPRFHTPSSPCSRQTMRRGRGAMAILALCTLLATGNIARADAYSDVQQLSRDGQAERALAQANAYIQEHPGDPQMRFVKANLLSSAGQIEQAQALLTDLTREYPELAEPWNNLAVLYANEGQLEAAEDALKSALRIDPSYATALENMGDVRLRRAQQAYEQARQAGNKSPGVARKIEALHELLQGTDSHND